MRILTVHGDAETLKSLEIMLGHEGFNVYGTDSGEEAEELGKLYDYDLLVLGDTNDRMPRDVVRTLRTAKINTPIIALSRVRGVENIVETLRVGADDYMSTPFHKDELVARIRAVVRRSCGHVSSKISVGDVVLDLDARTAMVSATPMHLTGKEYSLLELFMLRVSQVQSKEAILNHLYGGFDEPEVKIIDVFVCKLRKKLTKAGAAPDFVATVWGRGYIVNKPDQLTSPSIAPELREANADGLGRFGGRKEKPKMLSEQSIRELV